MKKNKVNGNSIFQVIKWKQKRKKYDPFRKTAKRANFLIGMRTSEIISAKLKSMRTMCIACAKTRRHAALSINFTMSTKAYKSKTDEKANRKITVGFRLCFYRIYRNIRAYYLDIALLAEGGFNSHMGI